MVKARCSDCGTRIPRVSFAGMAKLDGILCNRCRNPLPPEYTGGQTSHCVNERVLAPELMAIDLNITRQTSNILGEA